MANPPQRVLLAKIGAPHGLGGQVRLTSYTEDPLAVSDYGPLIGEDGSTYHVTNARKSKNTLIVKFREIANRDQAESLNGKKLYIERDQLPEENDDDAFYINDLVGMDVIEVVAGTEVLAGKIRAVQNFGAGDLLEISPKLKDGGFGQKTWFIAFTKANVPVIDINNAQVTIVKPPEIDERDGEQGTDRS